MNENTTTKYHLTFRRDGGEVRGMIEEVGMKLADRFGGVWICVKCEEAEVMGK